ncbi:ribosome small subunit-dependent GTPase A [Scatolibacter rhodanostii]|uniref:ribosome small subunit-dependent GTPase A n=1 Tax=Scatolibacter rhodanostii TaxID=2014781 RepID=UPI00190E8A9B|nr:ribosome small subunit-dependent GTPase A [Scatolibacter rhodanostii]
MIEGLILKGIGGFYYIETVEGIYECSVRGKFRKTGISPCAGDHVKILTEEDQTGVIDEILPRKNSLVRPAVANIDNLFIIVSLVDPSPDTLMIDKTIAAAEMNQIEPIIVITKNDLCEGEDKLTELKKIYDKAGVPCLVVSALENQGLNEIHERLKGKISALTGNSGVGKSTLLNALFPAFYLETGEISRKLGRGRHTTRQVELYKIEENSYVADTPGFSTFDVAKYDMTSLDELFHGFREFEEYFGQCKFTSCSHTCEKGCTILQAVEEGNISVSRHQSYKVIYQEIKDNKPW